MAEATLADISISVINKSSKMNDDHHYVRLHNRDMPLVITSITHSKISLKKPALSFFIIISKQINVTLLIGKNEIHRF